MLVVRQATGPTAAKTSALRGTESDLAPEHCLASPGWLAALSRAYGLHTIVFTAEDDTGRPAAILPAYYDRHCKTLYGLRYGLQAVSPEAARYTVQAAMAFAATEGFSAIDLGVATSCKVPGDFPVTETVGFEFNLAGCSSDDDLRKCLSSHGRRSLKAALASGQALRCGPEVLSDAIAVYWDTMRRKGVRLHSRAYFEEIGAQFGETFVPLVSYSGHEPVGAAFLLIREGVGAYLYGGSSRRGLEMQCGSLLYFEMMRWCMRQGVQRFDAGESRPGSGTFEFKRRLGGRQVPLRYLRADVAPPATLVGRYRRSARRVSSLLRRLGAPAGPTRRRVI